MKRLSLKLACLGALLALGVPAAAQTTAGASLRLSQPNTARFPDVTLFAYPTDARGVLVSGLSASAFQVEEDGALAQVTRVEAKGGSLDVCLALDRSPSMLDDNKLEYARSAAREFVGQLRPQDRAALITFSSGNSLDQSLTTDRGALLAAINRTQATGNSTSLYDAVYWSIMQVGLQAQGQGSVVGGTPVRPDARRVVVALTDGMDRGSRVLPPELLEMARQNGVSLFMISVGHDAEVNQMIRLANETGGVFLNAPQPQDLQRLYVGLAEQLRQEYRVTFKTPRPDFDSRKRAVRARIGSLNLQADASYIAPAQGSVFGGVPNVEEPAAGASVTGSDKADNPPPLFLVGAILSVLGVGGAIVGALFWFGNRRKGGERLAMADSNPRLDLLPLWVRQGENRIGRGPECELVLDSREVSRVHARIEAWDGVFRLIDEGSSNGTYVNGRRVRRKELNVGDTIRFGDREFRFAGELR